MKNRYEQLTALVHKLRPRIIVEVGVHGAVRATQMCLAARQRSQEIKYIGFDVFETMDADFHKQALNGKGIPAKHNAERRLFNLNASIGGVDWSFVIGDTAQTLHHKPVVCDFAFIDGDHRVEMIRGDAKALEDACPCMVFDDYYVPGDDGKITDIEKYGANVVIEEYRAAGRKVQILPKRDLTKEGCFAMLAVVTK